MKSRQAYLTNFGFLIAGENTSILSFTIFAVAGMNNISRPAISNPDNP